MTNAKHGIAGWLGRNRQFVLYCLIGGSGVLLDFGVYSLLLAMTSVSLQVANAAGYAAGTVLSFVLNAQFNFRTNDQMLLRFVSFCAVAAVGWAASSALLYWLTSRLGVEKHIAKALTIFVVVALQYNLNRLISFRSSPKRHA